MQGLELTDRTADAEKLVRSEYGVKERVHRTGAKFSVRIT